jgi:hypothetical protein
MSCGHKQAFTRWDLLICVASACMIGFWGFYLPSLGRAKSSRCGGIRCPSNLKQTALGFCLYASDHEDRFPWQLTTNLGGTLEYLDSSQVYRHFSSISNELQNPKILVCPSDSSRTRSMNWTSLTNANISYFIVMSTNQPVLSGDRLISTNDLALSGVITIVNPRTIRPISGLHEGKANLALMDGSVLSFTRDRLSSAFTNLALRLAVP